MPRPKRGELWLVRFPFSDLASAKVRPALVLAAHGEDVIVAGVFSKVPAGTPPDTWVRIEDSHPAFGATGLGKTSLLRAEKIAVVHHSVLHRQLGQLPADLVPKVNNALKKALLLP